VTRAPKPPPGSYGVVWSGPALAGLERMEAYVAQDAPQAAARLRAALSAAGDSLSLYPERGVLIRGGYRRLLVLSPFVIRYRTTGDLVVITSVRDDRQPLRS
jgi:plasmid stabilization system protein ParE